MRPATEVDQRAAPVRCGGGRLDALLQDAHLELVVAEHLEQVLLGDLQPLERLLLLDGRLHHSLDGVEVLAAHLRKDTWWEVWEVTVSPVTVSGQGLDANQRRHLASTSEPVRMTLAEINWTTTKY